MKKILAIIAIVAFTLNANSQNVVQYPFGPASVTTPSVVTKVKAQSIIVNNTVVVGTFSAACDTNKILNVSYPSINQYSNAYTPKSGSKLYLLITADATNRTVAAGTGFTFNTVTMTASKQYLFTFLYTGTTYALVTSQLLN